MLESLHPFPIVHFTVAPLVNALAMCLAILKVSEVRVVVRVPLETTTVPAVIRPFTLVLAAVRVTHDAYTMPYLFLQRRISDLPNVVRIKIIAGVLMVWGWIVTELETWEAH